ncbi:MAG: hypothetical protein FWB80_09730, partial [Defluviitaleaceae bacterium]|nr:hypothetical protein [Defluviitaleaceae bacterium]
MKKLLGRFTALLVAFLMVFGTVVLPTEVVFGDDVEPVLPITPPGAGTVGSPWLISEPGHLRWMNGDAQRLFGHFRLVYNIDAPPNFWITGTLHGTFDGQGNTITVDITNGSGLFSTIGSNATVRNLNVEGSITGSRPGGLAWTNNGTVTNSTSSVTFTGPGSILPTNAAGGLVAINNGLVINSSATSDITGGGLVGINNGRIENSYASGNVTDGGGLVAINRSTDERTGEIINSHASGNVTGLHVGGLVGVNEGLIYRSSASGNVGATSPFISIVTMGGLVGTNNGCDAVITDSFASGNVVISGSTINQTNVGGLVGINNDGDIWHSYASGDVRLMTVSGSHIRRIGGLVGFNSQQGRISGVYATGAIFIGGTAANAFPDGSGIGGVVGVNDSAVSDGVVALNSGFTLEPPSANAVFGGIWGTGDFDITGNSATIIVVNGIPTPHTEIRNTSFSDARLLMAQDSNWWHNRGFELRAATDRWEWDGAFGVPLLRDVAGEQYPVPRHPVTILNNPPGVVDGQPTDSMFAHHTRPSFTAGDRYGFEFLEWVIPSEIEWYSIYDPTTSITFTMPNSPVTLTANWYSIAVPPSFDVTFTAGNNGSIGATVDGSAITSGDEVTEGSTVVFTATPNSGFRVNEWTVNGYAEGNDTTLEIYLEEDIVVYVYFEQIPPGAISNYNVTIPIPVVGAAPVATFADPGGQWDAAIIWSPAVSSIFAPATVYTATVTVTPRSGFILTGIGANFFRINGGVPTTPNAANAGTFSHTFAATPAAARELTNVSANGTTETVTTTELTLTFDEAVSANIQSGNITIYGANVTVGNVSIPDGDNRRRTVEITGSWANGAVVSVTVVSPAGYTISGSPRNVTLHRAPTAIASAGVTLTAPNTGGIPADTAAAVSGGMYSVYSVEWQPAHNPFLEGEVYAVTVTLTAAAGHVFADNVTASVNGQNASITARQSDRLIFTFTFPPTPLFGIAIAPDILDFGYVTFGTQPAAIPVIITNTGNQNTGGLVAVLGGDDRASFTITQGANITGIAVGGSARVYIRPTVGLHVGSYAATVTINTATGNTNPIAPQAADIALEVTRAAAPGIAWPS